MAMKKIRYNPLFLVGRQTSSELAGVWYDRHQTAVVVDIASWQSNDCARRSHAAPHDLCDDTRNFSEQIKQLTLSYRCRGVAGVAQTSQPAGVTAIGT